MPLWGGLIGDWNRPTKLDVQSPGAAEKGAEKKDHDAKTEREEIAKAQRQPQGTRVSERVQEQGVASE